MYILSYILYTIFAQTHNPEFTTCEFYTAWLIYYIHIYNI